MKIGYPCINRSIERQGSSTFRLKSYSPQRLIETVANNIAFLQQMFEYNAAHGILFFRISSDIVPFASHPVCKYNWQEHFADQLRTIGKFIKKHSMRINMHPDQFILINAIDQDIVQRSIAELAYHADVLDLLGLGADAKIQIHVGGVYGDRQESIARFARTFKQLDKKITRRLVVENDHVNYGLADCMKVHELTSVPILFDAFHHSVLNKCESIGEAFQAFTRTWHKRDGLPMVDYSSQKPDGRPGSHTEHIDIADFKKFLRATAQYDFDVMLEIKDKETSAGQAIAAAKSDPRFRHGAEI